MPSGTPPILPGRLLWCWRDVHKSFGAQKVLNGIDLAVGSGETLVVLGRSGTGKSVLLKLIVGLAEARLGIDSASTGRRSPAPASRP